MKRASSAWLAGSLAIAAACSSQPRTGSPAPGTATGDAKAVAKPAQAHAFRGKVEKVDKATRSVTVAGEDVAGWMGPMTMLYEVQPADILEKLAVGDAITATVYDGDFKTLHDVKVVPPAPSK